jgi:single-stranded-DNA-specific exonuclease
MKINSYKWEVLNKGKKQKEVSRTAVVIKVLLENRGIKTKREKEEFFKPTPPYDLRLKELGIDDESLKRAIKRIKESVKKDEDIVIYGDYDADGICATAILWECLYTITKNVKPYIPDRFEEGYGINAESVTKLISQNPKLKLIITVDNGIVAYEAVKKANELGLDVIITDHHQPRTASVSSGGYLPSQPGPRRGAKQVKGYAYPNAFAIIHTTQISGSGVAWIFAREVKNAFRSRKSEVGKSEGLELAAIGTISDQLPLLGPNRSFAKYGLEALNKTKRPGLLALFEEAGLSRGPTSTTTNIGTYEVNFVIAPRINAMGRMEHAIDSLRLLCTKNDLKAHELAIFLGKTNRERQRVVDEVLLHARETAQKTDWKGVIVLAHETYHEGVIGLAAAKLVEEFYRPAIVLFKGKEISKASARSISGFNIIESIRKVEEFTLGGGGHPMAAGFSIETKKIDLFIKKYEEFTTPLLTDEILTKKLKIDMEIDLEIVNIELLKAISQFEPFGVGNPNPSFNTKNVEVVDARTVGRDSGHLKLILKNNQQIIDAIAFGMGNFYPKMISAKKLDIAYSIEENVWNGNKSLQLKIKDIHLQNEQI